MGFIDWHGTKEDRYGDMVEYAKMQQEEERLRIADERAAKWLLEILGSSAYSKMNIPDLMKQILLTYRKLYEYRDEVISSGSITQLDPDLLWKDFCIEIIIKHMDYCKVPNEKREAFYNTFLTKVFKLDGYTAYFKHLEARATDKTYEVYFSDCFDVLKEKQFWKFVGKQGQNDRKCLCEFVKTYEKLSIVLGYYLFQEIRPTDFEWMKAIGAEKQVLDRISEEYSRGRYKEPNYSKLKNPLYVTDSYGNNFNVFSEMKKEIAGSSHHNVAEPTLVKKHQIDEDRFNALLDERNLDAYIEACGLLRNATLPEEIDNRYLELVQRLMVLKESTEKYKDYYQPDLYEFYDFYIPEALQITVSFLEYLDAGIGENILLETEQEITEALDKLMIGVNEKIDEIYKFASIEIKAKAKALDSVMGQNGYVSPEYKFNNTEG